MQQLLEPEDQTTGPATEDVWPINRQVLHDALIGRLRQMIVEGVMSPGTRLNERILCAQLGVSRTPLREALKVLAAEGLIEHLPNRGATVTKMSEADIRDTFELMGGLEAFSGQLACERITPAEIAVIESLHTQMVECHERVNLPDYYRLNKLIHDHINRAARNEALRQTYLSVNRRLEAMRFRSNFVRAKWDHAVSQHEAMLSALKARDGALLAEILRSHLLEKRDAVLAEFTAAAARDDLGGH